MKERSYFLYVWRALNFISFLFSCSCSCFIYFRKIYYHGPFKLPSKLKKILKEDTDQKSYVTFEVVPLAIMSHDKIKNLFEFQRKCKFPDESSLKYFPEIYSQDLCLYECRIQKFLDLCKCIPFFYGHKGIKSVFFYKTFGVNIWPFLQLVRENAIKTVWSASYIIKVWTNIFISHPL